MSISKEAVFEKMNEASVVVLNVLPEEEFLKLHIRGSRNLPLTQDRGAFLQEVEKQFGKERFLIIYGSDIGSHAAIDATEALWKGRFKAETYLSGLREWKEAGFPTEGTDILKKEASK